VALVTVAATLATAPILAYHFNRVSLVSLPANLAVALLAETLFAAGVALAFLFWMPGAGWLLARAVEWLASATAAVVDTLGSLPMAEIHWPTPGLPAIASWYVLMAAVWWLLQTADPRGVPQKAKTPEHSR
jgi:competence protein ComEC